MWLLQYKDCSGNDAHIQHFWEALEAFDEEDKSLFLRFVWGRSRLPNNASGFTDKFKICGMNRRGDPNQMLPMAHTCFFQLDLPRYTELKAAGDKVRITDV